MRTINCGTAWTVALTLAVGLSGCKSNTAPSQPANIVDMNNGVDPASVNMAPVDPNAPVQTSYATGTSTSTNSRVLGERSQYPAGQAQGEDYPQQQQASDDPAYDQYQSSVDAGQAALYANDAPPPLPVYEQPELTQANDQWTPGYWGYGNGGYYWVPGAWVAPPYVGGLWTPGYWGYEGNRYRFHHGFWGRHIGFYGGVSYGFGYFGHGYEGGYWNNNNFYYNRQVNRVNLVDVRNVYVRNVTVVTSRVSYNGPGGYNVRPQPAELAVYHEQRLPPMQVQRQQMQAAANNRQQFFSANHGTPAVMVNPRAEADRSLPRPIQPAERGGFGQPGTPATQRTQAAAPQNAQQQRTQAIEQHNVQAQQRTQAIQQHNVQAQQHNVQEQQRTQAIQQRTAEAQQHNSQAQQRTNQMQQRDQQRTQQVQQHQAQIQQQHTAQPTTPHAQPQLQARPEPAARPAQQPQPRQEVARPVQQPQARPEPAPRAVQPQPHAQPAPQSHPQPAAQPHGNEHPRR